MLLTISDLYAKLAEQAKSPFITGLATGFLAFLVIWCIIKCVKAASSKKSAILINDNERGSFAISSPALSSFVERICVKYSCLQISEVKLYDTREGTIMELVARANYDCDLTELRNKLRDEILAEMSAKLGIYDQVAKVNVSVTDFVDKN